MPTRWGKVIKNGKAVKSATFTSGKQEMSAALLDSLEHFSKLFDMEMPMWHSQHTKQMGLFRKAIFKPGDFIDSVPFDRFELQLLGDEE